MSAQKLFFAYPGQKGFKELLDAHCEPMTIDKIVKYEPPKKDFNQTVEFTFKKKLKNRKQRKKYKMFMRNLMRDFMV